MLAKLATLTQPLGYAVPKGFPLVPQGVSYGFLRLSAAFGRRGRFPRAGVSNSPALVNRNDGLPSSGRGLDSPATRRAKAARSQAAVFHYFEPASIAPYRRRAFRANSRGGPRPALSPPGGPRPSSGVPAPPFGRRASKVLLASGQRCSLRSRFFIGYRQQAPRRCGRVRPDAARPSVGLRLPTALPLTGALRALRLPGCLLACAFDGAIYFYFTNRPFPFL